MRISRILIAAALLASANSAFASGWLKLTTPNFELFTTANEKKGREAILYFEQVRELFLRIRPGLQASPQPVRLIAFQNEKEYKRFRINETASAYYVGGDTRDYIVMGEIGADHFPIAVHEYSHLLVKHSGLKLPRWLDEGLADVHSTLHAQADGVAIGDEMRGRMQTLNRTKWMSLEALTAVNHDSPEYNEKSKAGIFYAESWLLTHMLYLSAAYRPKFSVFLGTMAALDSSEAAFREVYGKSLADVQKDLEFYRSVNYAFFKTKMLKPSDQPVARPASDLEAGLVEADLLIHIRKPAEAKEIYTRLAVENPRSWEAEQGLAYLARRAGELDQAKQHFGRAIDLGSNDGQAWFEYAKLLQEDPANDETLKKVLLKTLELRPDLADARLLLGFHCYNTRDYKGALEQLDQVKKVAPERATAFFLVIANSELQLGNRQDAKRKAERAREYAKTPEDIQKTEELLRYINGEPSPGRLRAEGTLQKLECLGVQAKIHILVDGKPRIFLIADPAKVQLKRPESQTMICGEQKGQAVLVEYTGNTDSAMNAEGIVQMLEIK